ncbi:MAG: hypothetical protein ACTS42_00535 [Candidatus Hodgkinia cicadicola]
MFAWAEQISPIHKCPSGIEWIGTSSLMLIARAQSSSTNVQRTFLISGKRKHAQVARSRKARALFCNSAERCANLELHIERLIKLDAEGPRKRS